MTSFRIRKGAFEIKGRLAILDIWHEGKDRPPEAKVMHYLMEHLNQERESLLIVIETTNLISGIPQTPPSYAVAKTSRRKDETNDFSLSS